ncbi:MAG: DUF1616 domain-containing protein [Halobacteriota archaeon]
MSSLLQLALAFIIVLVVPGFAASLALFPRLNQIDITERLAISIGLSITIVIAVGMLLSYGAAITGYFGGITAYSLSAALVLVTFFSLLIWALRATSLAITARRQAAKQRQAIIDLGTRSKSSTTRSRRPASREYDANRYRETTAQQREDAESKGKDSRPKGGV